MDPSQIKAFRFAGIAFVIAAIAFAISGNWLLALSFVVIAGALTVVSTQATQDPSE